jgi:hypothetical protein
MEISKQVQGHSSWNSLIKKGSDVKDDIPSIITIIMANITMLASSLMDEIHPSSSFFIHNL